MENDCGREGRAKFWQSGINFFIENVVPSDIRTNYVELLNAESIPDCCEKHLLNALSTTNDKYKNGGPRLCPFYIFFLDLFSVLPWTQFDLEGQMKQAALFTKMPDDAMYVDITDDDLYNIIYKFVITNVSLSNSDKLITRDDWVATKAWANHGAAGDVSFDIPDDMRRDKSSLAWSGVDAEFETPLINKVFPKRDRKDRIIVVGPTSEYIFGSWYNYVLINLGLSAPFEITNLKRARRWEDIFLENSSHYVLPLDQSAFDLNQRKSLIRGARDALLDMVDLHFSLDRIPEMRSLSEMILMPDKSLVEWEQGLLSGKWYTSVVGSIANAFEIRFRTPSAQNIIASVHQGDDALVVLSTRSECEELMNEMRENGIKINPNKNFLDLGRTDYLHIMTTSNLSVRYGSHWWSSRLGLQRYPARSTTSWLYGDQDASFDSATAFTQSMHAQKVAARAWNLCARSNNWDKFEKFCREKLSDEEIRYLKTPLSLGGGGYQFVFGDRGSRAVVVKEDASLPSSLRVRLGGFETAYQISKAQYPKLDRFAVQNIVSKKIAYNRLRGVKKEDLKKRYYNLKSTNLYTLGPKMGKVSIRVSNIDQFVDKPHSKLRMRWRDMQDIVDDDQETWDDLTRITWARLRRAGPAAQRWFRKGKFTIPVPRVRNLDSDQSSFLVKKRFQNAFLMECLNHGTSDLTETQLAYKKLSFEDYLGEWLSSQKDVYSV